MERRSVLIGAGSAAVAVGGTAVAWRLAAGSPSAYAQYADRLREPLPERAEIEDLIRDGLLEKKTSDGSEVFRLTRRGRLLGNQVFLKFVD